MTFWKQAFTLLLNRKNMRLVPPVTEGLLAIYPDDLTELLTIVLDNAVKYSPPGTTITVSMHAQRNHATLYVKDEGGGIAEDELPHIFKWFHRGTNSGQPKGYGLGLAVAKKLVNGAGGAISAESKLGQGTTIKIRLPISV